MVVLIKREYRILKEGLKRDEYSRFDMGLVFFVIGFGKKSGND